jgi:hypothetical protein
MTAVSDLMQSRSEQIRADAEATYRAEVDQIHAEFRAARSQLYRDYFNVRELQPNGTMGRKSGFIPAEQSALKGRNFRLVVAAQKRNAALQQED